MKILAVAHGLWRGGAQEATLEMFNLLGSRGVEINVLIGDIAETTLRSEIENLGIHTFTVRSSTVANYPDLAIEEHAELIKSSDIAWITDVEYLVAPRIKRIKIDLPVIASLHSYALVCPIWTALYGARETCRENCSHSLSRFTHCRQEAKQYRAQWHYKSKQMRTYQLLNRPKSYLEFNKWPMNEAIVENIDGFLAVSDFVRDLARIHLPSLAELPIEVIPNPVMIHDPDLASKDCDDATVLYASGPGIIKGPHIALYATRKLLDEGSQIKLIMLRTEADTWIRSLVRKLRMGNEVKLLPNIPKKQVSKLMANSTYVLMPSLYPETFGRIPVEANLLGTPAVVSNRGALPSVIVDKITGLVTEPSVDAFANSMNDALIGRWDRELIARVAKERFNAQRIIDDLIRFLNKFT